VQGALRLLDGATAAPYDVAGAAWAGAAWAGAASAGGAAPMARLCRELAVSRRTLERLFAEQVGLAPRTYARLRRVGAAAAALERAARGPAGSLSALAHGLGYADHAHMTREFTRVMGVTPSRYRGEALAAPVVRRLEGGEVAHDRRTPVGTVGTAEPGGSGDPAGPAGPADRRRAA
jgi:AraC-like DNA-binding protein